MQQPYFIVVLAHSLHGRLRRIQVPYQALYIVLVFALIGAVSVFGFVSSYVRMAWKVADYNNLRKEVSALRAKYQVLEKESKATDQQLASLQLLASEVSLAYGVKQLEGPADLSGEARLVPTVSESLEQYNFLRTTRSPTRSRSRLFPLQMLPSMWPVDGRLMSYFGRRDDPFSGQGAFHAGVDISAPTGTPVRVAADGVVTHAGWLGNYGKLVIVDHGHGVQTYYAHLSHIKVVEGQGLRRGETLALSGGTGRVTSPHLHYEVRRGGAPVNPRNFLQAAIAQSTKPREYTF